MMIGNSADWSSTIRLMNFPNIHYIYIYIYSSLSFRSLSIHPFHHFPTCLSMLTANHLRYPAKTVGWIILYILIHFQKMLCEFTWHIPCETHEWNNHWLENINSPAWKKVSWDDSPYSPIFQHGISIIPPLYLQYIPPKTTRVVG